jgi:hypothetical protein
MIKSYSLKMYYASCDGKDGNCDQVGVVELDRNSPELALMAAEDVGWKVIPTLKGDRLICPRCAKEQKK